MLMGSKLLVIFLFSVLLPIYTCAQQDFNIKANYNKIKPSLTTPKTPTTDKGLVTYYPFDGDTEDHSGNGNHGTNHGAAFVSGVSGKALSFDGKDDRVKIPSDVISGRISTLTLWVKTNDNTFGLKALKFILRTNSLSHGELSQEKKGPKSSIFVLLINNVSAQLFPDRQHKRQRNHQSWLNQLIYGVELKHRLYQK